MQQKYRAGARTELGAPAILVRSSSTDLHSLISTAHIALTSTPNSFSTASICRYDIVILQTCQY